MNLLLFARSRVHPWLNPISPAEWKEPFCQTNPIWFNPARRISKMPFPNEASLKIAWPRRFGPVLRLEDYAGAAFCNCECLADATILHVTRHLSPWPTWSDTVTFKPEIRVQMPGSSLKFAGRQSSIRRVLTC